MRGWMIGLAVLTLAFLFAGCASSTAVTLTSSPKGGSTFESSGFDNEAAPEKAKLDCVEKTGEISTKQKVGATLSSKCSKRASCTVSFSLVCVLPDEPGEQTSHEATCKVDPGKTAECTVDNECDEDEWMLLFDDVSCVAD